MNNEEGKYMKFILFSIFELMFSKKKKQLWTHWLRLEKENKNWVYIFLIDNISKKIRTSPWIN